MPAKTSSQRKFDVQYVKKQIVGTAGFFKWCKELQRFQLSDGVGDVYLHKLRSAKILASLWNPKNLSTRKVSLCLYQAPSRHSFMTPVYFYEYSKFVGKVYVAVTHTGESIANLWTASKPNRSARVIRKES